MRLQIRLVSPELHKNLKRIALESDITLNALCVSVLTDYVDKEKQKLFYGHKAR